jgi:energy-coupling factor transporter ATP-binding protein EcfA2
LINRAQQQLGSPIDRSKLLAPIGRVITFDETTRTLSRLTAHEVMIAVDAMLGNKTVLMIAHLPITLKVYDWIVMMVRGHEGHVGTSDRLAVRNEGSVKKQSRYLINEKTKTQPCYRRQCRTKRKHISVELVESK